MSDQTHPARFPRDFRGALHNGTRSEYPISWSEILGDIFLPICYEFSEKIKNTLPQPVFHDYQ